MKNSKTHLLRNMAAVTLLCAGFASCSQNDFADTQGEPLPQGEYPLELTAGGLQTLSAPASARGTADDNWDGVQSVAVQVGDVVKEYTVTSPNNESTATLTSDEPFYWQTTEEVMNITAWYPYSDASPDPDSWTVKADQSVAANYQASDLIKGELTLAFADRNNPEKNKLTFNHQMVKIEVMLDFDGITPENNTTVKLLNVVGVAGGGTDITCYRPSSDQQTYYAILPPQTIENDRRFIQVSVDGNDFSYIPFQIRVLKPGKIYAYNVTVTATGITVRDAVIKKWTTELGSDNVDAGVPLQVVAEKAGDASSRASGTSWDNGDIIGISVTGTEGTTTGSNVPYTLSGSTWKPVKSINQIVFKDLQTVTFSAYYPYAETDNMESGKIAGNTTDQSKQSTFDYMFTSGVTASMTSPRVAFTGDKKFKHCMSRINITIRAGTGVDKLDELAACAISGLVADGTFDTITGIAAASVSGTASDMTVTSNGSSTFSFIVFPQEVADGFTVEVENGNNLYGVTLTVSGGKLLPGSTYSYNVTLNKQS